MSEMNGNKLLIYNLGIVASP